MKNETAVLTLKEKQKIEALRRLRMLHIMPEVIKDFENNDRVYYSERQDSFFNATLYWLDNHQEYMDLVKEFERKYNAIVYHAQLTHLIYGDNLALFYVSDSEQEWECDRNDIVNGQAFVKIVNLEDDLMSDFGSIGIKPSMGGVTRTW